MSENKKCAQCGQEKPIEDFSKLSPEICIACEVSNAMHANTNVFDFTTTPQFIPHPRFIASVAAMQGMLASGLYQTNSAQFIAQRAVLHADALLNELNKPKNEMATDK